MDARTRILIVDDNPSVRMTMRFYLQEMAGEIRECEDGVDAFAAYADFRPDWVLMDWEMRRVDGLTATRAITHGFPNAKIVMVTQYCDEELRAAAIEAGALGLVPKYDLSALLAMLKPNH